MTGFKRLVKNSFSNIINGFSNVILGVVLSPLLLHSLSIVDFSIWSLTLQVGVMVGIIGIGIQVTVGRFVALHLNDVVKRQRVMQQSLLFAFILGAISLVFILIVAQHFFSFFPQTANSNADVKQVFVLISSAFVLNNLSAPFVGYFTGIERNDIMASVNIIFKVLLGCTIIFLIEYGLNVISWAYFVINALNQIAFYILYKIKSDKVRFKATFDIGLFKTIVIFFSGLLIWNISQFLISGIGTFTVGKFAFSELAGFAVLMTLVNTGVGILGALINPIIQPMIRMRNSGNNQHVELMVNKLTLLFSLIVFIGVFCAWFLSIHVLGIWLGHEQATNLHVLFSVLFASYLIRVIAAPYGLMLVAYGKQLSIAYLPVIEGILNFILSILFVQRYGAIGIAYSTFISGTLIMIVYACKYRLEAETKSNMIFISFVVIPLSIAASMVALLITKSSTVHGIIYVVQVICIGLSAAVISKQVKSLKIILNQY